MNTRNFLEKFLHFSQLLIIDAPTLAVIQTQCKLRYNDNGRIYLRFRDNLIELDSDCCGMVVSYSASCAIYSIS